jgi:thiamine-monophosphate kinase
LVIKKCLRSSLSDLICKGVNPKYYFIASAGNSKHFTKINLSKISKALKSEQKKFSIKLSGGDTTYSNTLSFTFVVIGYSTSLPVLRNGAKLNDDIYITNTVGDAFLGLYIIKKNKKILNHKYFVNSFYLPNIPYKFGKKMHLFANAAIDISDGLFQDINHLMENSKLTCDLDLNKIPISIKLAKYLKVNNKNKKLFISKGDDYQILFTANKNKRNLIKRIAKKTNTLITKIGITKKLNFKKNHKNQGYLHKFK